MSAKQTGRRAGQGAFVAVLCLLTAAGYGSAEAQSSDTKWWESLFDAPGSAKRREADAAKHQRQPEKDVVRDLREDATPWRSDTMIEQMDKAVARYHKIVARGGWQTIPKGRTLRLGDDDERVYPLRGRLVMTGDLPAHAATESYSLDETVEAGLKKFQDRHGLRLTGRLDPPTLAQLNVSAFDRLEQLKLNQRRIRELLQIRIEDRYILVNAAAFQLEAVEGYEVQQRHRVIVGKPDRQTPTVRATIRALNFFPYWRVPESVATLDLIPRLRKEPDYLSKEQIRVFNGTYSDRAEIDPANIDWRHVDPTRIKFRQDPGPQNALGLVRIDMPNEHTVYMHDTPMKPLFNQRERAFSAGCVRVQDVFKLVTWIARQEPGWQAETRVYDTIESGQASDVTLTRPIPVYFTYLTAWAEPRGRIEFRPDIYNRDGSREFAGERDPDAPPPPQTLAP
ncbi:MAG: L,D-transpeptidase family protein [Hyphomicrobiaceae bacterium]